MVGWGGFPPAPPHPTTPTHPSPPGVGCPRPAPRGAGGGRADMLKRCGAFVIPKVSEFSLYVVAACSANTVFMFQEHQVM